jgi:hypothetical protein
VGEYIKKNLILIGYINQKNRMAGLPHFSNSIASMNNFEPVYLNQFEVVITPPAVIGGPNVSLLVEHVTKLGGLPEIKSPGTLIEQEYKFATRSYAGPKPDTTVADLKIDFTVNLNEENDAYDYNILRAWNDIVYNPQSGAQGLKRNYVGEIAVVVFNKAGEIFREFKFPSVIPNSNLSELSLDYTGTTIYELSATYRADYWIESRVGQINV